MSRRRKFTEGDWQNAVYPGIMLDYMYEQTSDRKQDLLAVACFRHIWHLLKTEQGRHAVELLERYAEGKVTSEQLAEAKEAAWQSNSEITHPEGKSGESPEVLALAAIGLAYSFQDMMQRAADATAWVKVNTPEATSEEEEKAQCLIVRDILGNPFRLASINPIWLTPTVSSLAQSAYDERIMPSGELDPERLAVLSDALEEAGCDNEDILNHLRSPGPHVRGCWVLDLLLGKE